MLTFLLPLTQYIFPVTTSFFAFDENPVFTGFNQTEWKGIFSLPMSVVDCANREREIDAVGDGNAVVIIELAESSLIIEGESSVYQGSNFV